MVSGGLKTAQPVLKTLQNNALEQNRVVPAQAGHENTCILVGCGQTIPQQQIEIVHPETLIPCAADEVGDIWVSSPSFAQGYWQMPEATEQVFCARLHFLSSEARTEKFTQNRSFLRTGDLGFLDNGELFVTGRLKDIIILNGFNYYPQDIEWTVEQTHPFIRPNCTASFLVEIDGEARLIVLAEVERSSWERVQFSGASQENLELSEASLPFQTLKVKQLIQSIRQSVTQHHNLLVHTVLLLKPGSIPKTSSGKVQRHVCRTSFLAGTLESEHVIVQGGEEIW
jgi:acyl-CoA synthetase (AMP-forming)/AMP-acid ligase II